MGLNFVCQNRVLITFNDVFEYLVQLLPIQQDVVYCGLIRRRVRLGVLCTCLLGVVLW